ncbi:MAG: LuxR C-terminal-related transcriptional regulator [Bacteroidetes bacterium]|nr:LuxR C-terminal-related transcriptional regulator [Bacteroidota bacterium]
MVEPANLIISLINLISLILGGFSLGIIFWLSRRNNASYLNYFFFFLVCAVTSGFCDWIIFNWVLLLVPGISSTTADLIYHIFWDLIGLPTALFSVYFLIRTINGMLKLHFKKVYYLVFSLLLFIFTILSYLGFYFRLEKTESFIGYFMIKMYTYIIPAIILSFLLFAYYKSIRLKKNELAIGKFIIILFSGFFLWNFLSIIPVSIGVWRHVIILSYYLALFIPSIYLYVRREDFKIIPVINNNMDLEEVFTTYHFTSREKELVFLLLDGKSNQEISEKLFISLQTTKNYVSNIYKKVGLKNRVQFVNFIRQHL